METREVLIDTSLSIQALIGFRDLAIACVALRTGLPVATHNRAEFTRVSGLEVFELEAGA